MWSDPCTEGVREGGYLESLSETVAVRDVRLDDRELVRPEILGEVFFACKPLTRRDRELGRPCHSDGVVDAGGLNRLLEEVELVVGQYLGDGDR